MNFNTTKQNLWSCRWQQLSLLAIGLLTVHLAFAYPDSLKMTCKQAQQFVQKHGPVILATGEAFATFYPKYCPTGTDQAGYVRASDQQFCYVGTHCGSAGGRGGGTGSYFQGTDDLCTEGAVSTGSRVIGHDGRGRVITAPVQIVCRQGQWTDPESPTVPDPSPAVCKEGAVTTSWRPSGTNASGKPSYAAVRLVCHANHWQK